MPASAINLASLSFFNREPSEIGLDRLRFSALGNLTPTGYADGGARGLQRGGALRYTAGSAPSPFAPPSRMGSNEAGTLLIPR
jgi:hypothetical protein